MPYPLIIQNPQRRFLSPLAKKKFLTAPKKNHPSHECYGWVGHSRSVAFWETDGHFFIWIWNQFMFDSIYMVSFLGHCWVWLNSWSQKCLNLILLSTVRKQNSIISGALEHWLSLDKIWKSVGLIYPPIRDRVTGRLDKQYF